MASTPRREKNTLLDVVLCCSCVIRWRTGRRAVATGTGLLPKHRVVLQAVWERRHGKITLTESRAMAVSCKTRDNRSTAVQAPFLEGSPVFSRIGRQELCLQESYHVILFCTDGHCPRRKLSGQRPRLCWNQRSEGLPRALRTRAPGARFPRRSPSQPSRRLEMSSECRAKVVFKTGRKSRMTCSFLALRRAEHMHQTFVWIRAKLLDYLLQVPIVSRAEVLRGVLDLGELLEESSGGVVSARPPGVGCAGFVFSLPFPHCLHEVASHGRVLWKLEDNGDLMLQQR